MRFIYSYVFYKYVILFKKKIKKINIKNQICLFLYFYVLWFSVRDFICYSSEFVCCLCICVNVWCGALWARVSFELVSECFKLFSDFWFLGWWCRSCKCEEHIANVKEGQGVAGQVADRICDPSVAFAKNQSSHLQTFCRFWNIFSVVQGSHFRTPGRKCDISSLFIAGYFGT